jgi:hypothetical protein
MTPRALVQSIGAGSRIANIVRGSRRGSWQDRASAYIAAQHGLLQASCTWGQHMPRVIGVRTYSNAATLRFMLVGGWRCPHVCRRNFSAAKTSKRSLD